MIRISPLREGMLLPPPISKEVSAYIKGGAVLLMVVMHYMSNNVFSVQGKSYLNGVCCVALFAFVTGYAHSYRHEHSPGSHLESIKRMFLPFYWRYILILMGTALLWWATRAAFSFEQMVLSVLCLKPNVLFDSWWYVFFFMLCCFVLSPCMRNLHHKLSECRLTYWFSLFLGVVLCFFLPVVFYRCSMPPAFTTVWNDVPVLRAILTVPYYLIGYLYCLLAERPFAWGGIVLVGMLACCVFWPFDIYGIDNISVLDIGASFCLCIITLAIMTQVGCIRFVLSRLGKVSAFWWLLHMPVFIWLMHSPSFLAYVEECHMSFIRPRVVSFLLSLGLAFLLSFLSDKVGGIVGKARRCQF